MTGSPAADDGDSAAGAAARRVSPWFSLVGLLLVATVLAAAFVQARQTALIRLAVQTQDEYLVINLYQVEVEYLRLRDTWRQSLQAPDSAGLQLRYDIFISRVSMLESERALRLLGDDAQADASLAAIRRFIQQADLYLGPAPRTPLSPSAAQALLASLEALDGPVHQTLLSASHRTAATSALRQQQVRDHNLIALGLTGFLMAMVLLFGALALRQMRRLDQRRLQQQQLADALRDARIEAEAANQAKSEFLADMSHELRTPLHGLLGMLSLARESPRDPRATDWVRSADESAHHLQRLVDDIVDLSQLEAGTLALAPAPVNLAELVHEVHTLLQPLALAKGLGLQLDLQPGLPTPLMLDATRVRQVLFNLLANAIKFSEAGQVVLRCRASALPGQAAGGQAMLLFEVADAGIGMDRETLARLFRRYSRADDPRARRQGGSGLGLAISRQLATLMGGDLVVDSSPGNGSVFTFQCPLERAAGPATEPVAPLSHLARPLQVLVAEDHPVNRLYLATLLARMGHRATVVDDGSQAVQAVQATAAGQAPLFDLVLMDVHMPVQDGLEATRALRSLPPPAGQVCVVALTADSQPALRERCQAAGIDEVLLKPLSAAALRALVARRFADPAAEPGAPALPALEAPAVGGSPWPGLLDAATLQSVRDLMGAAQLPGLYGGFFTQAEDAARRMRDALRAADTEGLRRTAHNVKGAALTLGLPALAESAAVLSRDAASLGAAPLALAVQRYEEITAASRSLCAGEGLLA